LQKNILQIMLVLSMKLEKEKFHYFLIRFLTFPFGFLPYSWIHHIGKALGWSAFYFMRSYRKRALSNLSLARDLALSPKQIVQTAKKSFQNLAINCLEYPKLARETNLSKIVHCQNPETALSLHRQGQGIIFFCGHQSNWEILFLDGTTRMQGVAIGRPTKNKYLYQWIVSIREKFGGKIIAPRNAVREGFRALKKGYFLGIVGDQAMPDSGYSFPFFGRRAWTSTAPALLAYKTNCPIISAATTRVRGKYQIRYSNPIWPNLSEPPEKEVIRLMNQVLTFLQESIRSSPGEWLWQHNRWKQQTPHIIYNRFRQDCICIILPEEDSLFEELLPHLATLKHLYQLDFLSLLVPQKHLHRISIQTDELIPYTHLNETLLNDFRFKLIYNFTPFLAVKNHYEKLSAFEVVDLATLKELANPHLPPDKQNDWSEIFKRALCRPGSIWQSENF
jgi:KDO2-lipid IV(A) lauroyltransferase